LTAGICTRRRPGAAFPRFLRRGIDIPFPTQTIAIRAASEEPDQRLAHRARGAAAVSALGLLRALPDDARHLLAERADATTLRSRRSDREQGRSERGALHHRTRHRNRRSPARGRREPRTGEKFVVSSAIESRPFRLRRWRERRSASDASFLTARPLRFENGDARSMSRDALPTRSDASPIGNLTLSDWKRRFANRSGRCADRQRRSTNRRDALPMRKDAKRIERDALPTRNDALPIRKGGSTSRIRRDTKRTRRFTSWKCRSAN